MLTVSFILTIVALILLVAHLIKLHVPLWVPVAFLIFIHLLQSLPVGK